MTADAGHIDIDALPAVARLVAEVGRLRRPCVLERNGKQVALLVPAPHRAASRPARTRVDTSDLADGPRRTLDEILRRRAHSYPRPFTEDEIKLALHEAREEAWRAKQARSGR